MRGKYRSRQHRKPAKRKPLSKRVKRFVPVKVRRRKLRLAEIARDAEFRERYHQLRMLQG